MMLGYRLLKHEMRNVLKRLKLSKRGERERDREMKLSFSLLSLLFS